MRRLEADVEALRLRVRLLCCPAQPEVEIYACAAFRDELPGTWGEVRASARMKEEIFNPVLVRHGDPRRPGCGRDRLIAESLRNLPLLFRLCPELTDLRNRVAELIGDP